MRLLVPSSEMTALFDEDYSLIPDAPPRKEFVSEIERKFKPARELTFDPTPGFGEYAAFFPKESVAHPAKMNLWLLKYLIETYTKPGETIADPMGGTCSTAILSALHGRNAVTVELEDKFVKWGELAKERIEAVPSLTARGKITVLKGDARNLSKLLGSPTDATITSPPYSDTLHPRKGVLNAQDNMRGQGFDEGYIRGSFQQPNQQLALAQDGVGKDPGNIGLLKHGDVDTIVTSPPYHTRTDGEGLNRTGIPNGRGINRDRPDTLKYSDDKEGNIGEIKGLGKVDDVIMSPPYATSATGHNRDVLFERLANDPTSARFGRKSAPTTAEHYSKDRENIGNLQPGTIDEIITSPPYADTAVTSFDSPEMTRFFMQQIKEKGFIEWEGVRYTEEEWRAMNHGRIDGRTTRGLSKGKVGYVDAEITSPPYEGSEAFREPQFLARTAVERSANVESGKSNGHPYSPEAEARYAQKVEGGRIEDPANIGKLAKATYLSEIFKVYQEMWVVLKPGGKAIIVVKPFQRQGKVVDLVWQTWLLLEKVGFQFEDVLKLRLRNLSFWRVLAYRKNPTIERIVHEYVLVVKKPVGEPVATGTAP